MQVFSAPRVGLEPTTTRLTAECSTIELSRIILFFCTLSSVCDRVIALPLSYRGSFSFLRCLPHPSPVLGYPLPVLPIPSKLHIDQSLSNTFPTWISLRPISSSQLHTLLHFHLCPIYLVVFKGSYYFRMRYLILRGASRLDAFSVYPRPTWLPGHALDMQPVHQRSVHPGPLVLRTAPLRYLTPAPDRDRTVSRRSEPSSRTALMGEQPNPWDLLQPQDAMSRHRGAKPLRRCELLGVISLLSPG